MTHHQPPPPRRTLHLARPPDVQLHLRNYAAQPSGTARRLLPGMYGHLENIQITYSLPDYH